MDSGNTLHVAAIFSQLLVGLSRSMVLFIVCSGMSFVLSVIRVPNLAHGSLYMIGAFTAYSISRFFGGGAAGFWLALITAPFFVALIGLVAERVLFCRMYQRDHLMIYLCTFALMLILGDLVKLVWGAEYRSIMLPQFLTGSIPLFHSFFPRYNVFLLAIGCVMSIGLWLFLNKTRLGKIARAAAVDREMVGAVGINVSQTSAVIFAIGCYFAGLGGTLVAPTVSISQGMDLDIIIEAFLIVTIGGLGNKWGALVGSLIFGLTQAFGVMFWPQFAVAIPYAIAVIILTFRPEGLLKSLW